MAVPALVFDLDGTLVDSGRDLIATLNVILAGEGAPPLPLETIHSILGGGARLLIERGLAASGRNVSPARIEELYDAFMTYYAAHLADETVPFDGVIATLDRLKAAGHAMVVCTNKMTDHSEALLRHLGMDHYFGVIAGRDKYPWFKPDPRHLTLPLAAVGADPAGAIMIGDSITDVRTADNAGVPSILVDFGYTDIPARELGATRVISHFPELTDAIDAVQAQRRAA